MVKQKFGKKDIFDSVAKERPDKQTKSYRKTQIDSEKHKEDKVETFIRRPIVFESPRTVIHSFRVREDLLEKIKEYAFFENVKIYKVVNQAIEEFLKNYRPEYSPRSK